MPATTPFVRAAALACAAAFATATPARADTFALGLVTDPTVFTVTPVSHAAPFEDVFTFTVASGASLVFSASFNTPYSNWFWINDLDGQLAQGGTTLAEGDGVTVPPPPFVQRTLAFAPLALSAGEYALHLTGTPTSVFPGPLSSYEGRITFNAAGPVPEPGTAALVALGLVGVALARRRR